MVRTILGLALVCGWVGKVAGEAMDVRGSQPQSHPPTIDARQFVQLVLDAYENNDRQLKSLRGTVHEVLSNSGVTTVQRQTIPLASGRVATITTHPRRETHSQIVLSQQNFKLDRTLQVDGNAQLAEQHVLRGELWTHHAADAQAAWIHLVRQGPGMFPLDPRHVGSLRMGMTLVDCLREEKVVDVVYQRQAKDKTWQLVTVDAAGETYKRYFSESQSFLPIRCETVWPDGSLCQVVTYEYQPVPQTRGFVLKTLVRRFYRQGVARHAASEKWHQQLERHLTIETANTAIPDHEFQLTFPSGTRVTDNVRGVIFMASPPLRNGVDMRARLIWMVITSALLVGLASVKFAQYRPMFFPFVRAS